MTCKVEQVGPWQWRVTLCWSGGPCDGLEVAATVEHYAESDALSVWWPEAVTWANPDVRRRLEASLCEAVRQHMREAQHDRLP